MNKALKKYSIENFSLKRLMIWLLLVPLFIYPGLLIFAYFFSDRLIFQPFPPSYRDNAEIIKLTTSDGEKISAKFYENPNATHTILFSHGNAEDIGELEPFLKEFQRNNFAVFAYDYRGYGTSEGNPSEEKVYRDIDAAYDYLTIKLKIPPEKIIAYGRSLGGAVSIDLASRKKIGGLIAESTFVSAFRVMTKARLTPFDKFESIKKIKSVKCSVLFIHGQSDSLVLFRHAEQLFAEANEPKFSYWIDDANHNDVYLIAGKAYFQKIRDFADSLPK